VNRDLVVVLLVIAVFTVAMWTVYGVPVLQFLINGVVVGSIIVLGATGLSLIYGIRKFGNFAHGEMMTFGAYMAFLISVSFAMNIIWGLIFGVFMAAMLGILFELLVFRKLAGRGPVAALVASIGIAIFMNNLINATFGTQINVYNLQIAQSLVLLTIDGRPVLTINPIKGLATLAVSAVLIIFLHVVLSRTTLGKAMRATSDNPDLARASGINIRNVILWVWAISGGLAAVAGVLLGIVNDVRPAMGFSILLFVFAAVIIGGIGSPYGAMLGGLIVGIAGELSVALLAWLGRPTVLGLDNPTAYRPVAAFVIMILVLLLRPAGLGGRRGPTLRTRRILRVPRWAKRERAQ